MQIYFLATMITRSSVWCLGNKSILDELQQFSQLEHISVKLFSMSLTPTNVSKVGKGDQLPCRPPKVWQVLHHTCI